MNASTLRILLVEDNPDDARLLREMLAESGRNDFEWVHAETLVQAWEALEAGEIDLILLDLTLPDCLGTDTFPRVFERHPDAPIVVLTGLQDEELALRLLQMGAQDYLLKGEIDGPLLERSIRYAIGRHRLGRALQTSEKRFRQIVEQNADGLLILDREGRVRLANPAAETLLDRGTEALVGLLFGYPLTADEMAQIDVVRPSGEVHTLGMRLVEITWEGDKAFLVSLRDITWRRLREVREKALSRVREKVWGMEKVEDFEKIVRAMQESFAMSGVRFQECGINIIDPSSEPPEVTFYNMSREGVLKTGREKVKERDIIAAFWKRGEPVYRRDLAAEDRYQEREDVGRVYGHMARSVLDIPFSHGTLALKSEDPDAFSPQDIALVRELAEVLSEGCQRREDLSRLEEKNKLLAAFQEIGKLALSSLETDSILTNLAEAVMRFGIFRSLMIALVDRGIRSVEVVLSGAYTPDKGLEWDPDRVTGLRYSLDSANITAQVARTGEPAVIEEWDDRLDPRVGTPEGRRGKVAYFIPVRKEGQVLAVLSTGSEREDKEQTLRRIEAMQPLLDQVAVALEHARRYEKSNRTLQEREALLREIHHRVKNNLQIIASLLRLASRNIDDPDLLEIFAQSQHRIHSMSLVHETLYHSGDLARVNFREYLRKLIVDLQDSYSVEPSAVAFRTHIDETTLEVIKAVPCGLLVNELVANALKHAFPDGRRGEICVDFRRRDGQFVLRVADDGIGLAGGLEEGQDGSFGMRLVHILTRQLDGQLCVHADCGTTVEIVFPA